MEEAGDGGERVVWLLPVLITCQQVAELNSPLCNATTDKIYPRHTHLHLMKGARRNYMYSNTDRNQRKIKPSIGKQLWRYWDDIS